MAYLILFTIFCSISHAIDFGKLTFIDGCTMYSLNGKPTNYPGAMCIFLDDGNLISTSNSMKMLNPDGKILWDLPGGFHHQTTLSPDGKRILALNSEIIQIGDTKSRDDVLQIISIDGKVLHRRSTDEIYKELKLPHLEVRTNPLSGTNGAQFERSHFNSIYEVPENKLSGKLPSHKAGNIIANSLHIGFFIFSPDLSKVFYHKKFPGHSVHDVQVSESGEILYFNNEGGESSETRFSSIEKLDPVKDKVTFSFTGKPHGIFYSPQRGGVQEYDQDTIFFNDLFHGGYFYSRKKKSIIRTIPGKYGDISKLAPTQHIKIIDARKFLEKNQKSL